MLAQFNSDVRLRATVVLPCFMAATEWMRSVFPFVGQQNHACIFQYIGFKVWNVLSKAGVETEGYKTWKHWAQSPWLEGEDLNIKH